MLKKLQIKEALLLLIAATFGGSACLQAQVIAFPYSYGFGSAATGGRGGTIVHVTNLNDSGAGSFRTAVGTANSIVVFDVGGYVTLSSAVSVANNVTIEGQTAPGGGIGIQNDEVSFSNCSNVICRGVRFRQGSNTDDTGESAVNLGDANNIIFDHCSVEFGVWDSVDAVGATNFTFQNSIIADPIGQQFGAHVETGPCTFYNNVWVNGHNRQPLVKCNTQFINNVIYNYQAAYTTANTGGAFSHDIIDNYFITGPSTTDANDDFYQMGSNQSVYYTGNLLDSNDDGVLNGSTTYPGGVTVLTSPWSSTTSSIPTTSAAASYALDITCAGALPHDQVDSMVLGQVESLGTEGSILSDQSSDGLSNDGYGTIASGTPFPNADGDGIADYWATAEGISTTNGAVGTQEYGTTGYDNIEVYANSLILPLGWFGQDIGSPSVTGQTSYIPIATHTWILAGAGSDIYGTSDQFQFASTVSSGTRLEAEVVSQTNTYEYAKAGVMWRDSTAADAANAFIAVTPSEGVTFQWRTTDGGATSTTSISGVAAPVYLRLLRSGNNFSGYYSTNGGNTWTQVGATQTITMPTDAPAGLAVCSHNTSEFSVGVFQNVAWP